MTVRDVFGAMVRRWYVVVVAVASAVVLGTVLSQAGGAFWSTTEVSFRFPSRPAVLPESGNSDSSVIAFAGAVASAVSEGQTAFSYATVDAPTYGAGVRQGVSLGLRDNGGQWTSSFPTATIQIRIVGRSYEWVKATQSDLLERVEYATEAQQAAAGTPEAERIEATVEPLSTQIVEVVPSRSSVLAAWGALLFAGLLFGGWMALVLDRMVRRRRARRTAGELRPAITEEQYA